jgi:phosphoglycerol transferase MdoB-like AlkP superfamily enzyme
MAQKILPEIIALLLQDIPESLAMTLLIFSLVKIRYEAKPILCIASMMALTNLVVRHLPIAFGVHTVILIFAFVINTRLFTRAQLSKIFLSVLLTTAFLVAAEMVYTTPLFNWTGITYEECFADPFLRAAFALPGEVFILLLALGIRHYNFKKRGL